MKAKGEADRRPAGQGMNHPCLYRLQQHRSGFSGRERSPDKSRRPGISSEWNKPHGVLVPGIAVAKPARCTRAAWA